MRNINKKSDEIKTMKRVLTSMFLAIFMFTNFIPLSLFAEDNGDNIIYPLKQISKLSCRYQKFSEMSEDCKKDLPILNTKDYKKYLSELDGFNEMTRTYSMLWGASYKYGWDQGNGGHIGTDIATAEGTPVYSIANGKVVVAGNLVGHGNVISIQHKIRGKVVISDYAHLSKMDVVVGDIITVGQKIGEVGSTGNSTGNHLHFEIDLESNSYPYYYNYKTCPFSYYEITESGSCFNELANNTIDPLLFLETKGAILDQVEVKKITTVALKKEDPKPVVVSQTFNENQIDLTIFDRTVYKDSDINDIKRVQQVLNKMGKYNGAINGNYGDIEDIIFKFQVEKNLLQTKQDDGAGWFGPKTRSLIKGDYNIIIAGGKVESNIQVASNINIDDSLVNKLINDTPKAENTVTSQVSTDENIKKSNIKTEKISKEKILTREQIEAMEVKSFLNKYNVDLKFEKTGGNVEIGKESIINLTVTDSKGQLFVGNMPGGMTFDTDKTKLGVFPEKLFNFTDGKREIKLTGIKDGNTKLNIKIGGKLVKTFDTKIYSSSKIIYPKSGNIISDKNVILGEAKTGYVVFSDEDGRKMINLPYGGDYRLKGGEGVKICIKRGEEKDLNEIINKRCKPQNYIDEVAFSYKDTIGGTLVFDYKVSGKKANIELINSYKNVSLNKKEIAISKPKGLSNDYAYKDEVLAMLENQVVEGVNNGYFQQDLKLTQDSSVLWIENALKKMKNGTTNKNTLAQIDQSLGNLKNEQRNKNVEVSRIEFLNKVYNYMIFDKNNSSIKISYKDLDNDNNKKANLVFDKNNTWKDQFGENYYRPNEGITRGETAYFLSKVIDKNKKVFVTLK